MKDQVRDSLRQHLARNAIQRQSTNAMVGITTTNATNTAATTTTNATNAAVTTTTTINAANANAANANTSTSNAANANETLTPTTTKRCGKIHNAPPREVNALDELMNAVINQQGGNGDTLAKKVTTIRGLLNTVTLDENRKCDDFERYLHRLHGRVVREVTRALQMHRNIKVQLQVDAHYEKLKPKEQPQAGGARTRKQRREEEERQRQEQEQRELEEEVEGDEVVVAKRAPVTIVTQLTTILNAKDVRGRSID